MLYFVKQYKRGDFMIEVEISGIKIVRGYTSKQKEQILDELTFPNPAYESAKKHSRWGTGKIPPFNEYYLDGMGSLIVPRGYKIPFPHKIVSDNRIINDPVPYPKLHIKLRGTQEEAVENYLKRLNDDPEHGVIVLPTGKGKSILGLYLARKLQQRVLVIVQKDDLVSGWTQDAKVILGLRPKQVGIIKAKEFRIGKQITVSTIQTLAKLPPEKIRELHEVFGMIIVDEFHHSVAKIYKLAEYFPAKYRIGLTATPQRNDGLTDVLNLYFGNVAYEYVETAHDEDILPVTVKLRNVPFSYQPEAEYVYNPKTGKKDARKRLNASEARKAVTFDSAYNTMLAKDVIHEVKKNKSCVVFTHEKDHCELFKIFLMERGVPESKIQVYNGDSKTPKDEMKRKAETKEVLVTIATYAIATEGTNVKAWERGYLATSIANEKDTIQAVGRIRRTKADKPDCVLYDYRFPNVQGMSKHGIVRDSVYRERGFNVIGVEVRRSNRKPTGRGWGRRK
jgi:superfamily II DNA or RNA helicase